MLGHEGHGDTPQAGEAALRERIQELTEQQHAIRATPGQLDSQRLQSVSVELDRLWDLVRQRQALKHAGKDPDLARERPAGEVEGYWQ